MVSSPEKTFASPPPESPETKESITPTEAFLEKLMRIDNSRELLELLQTIQGDPKQMQEVDFNDPRIIAQFQDKVERCLVPLDLGTLFQITDFLNEHNIKDKVIISPKVSHACEQGLIRLIVNRGDLDQEVTVFLKWAEGRGVKVENLTPYEIAHALSSLGYDAKILGTIARIFSFADYSLYPIKRVD